MAKNDSGPTLTNITAIGRQAVKYGIILLVVLIVGRTLLNAFTGYWKATHPPAPPPPTMGFGSLPQIDFPSQAEDDKPTSYSLETSNGRLPGFGDRTKVFLMPKNSLSLLSDKRVREIAQKWGYIYTPNVLGAMYRWTKSQPIESVLNINAETLNTEMTSDFKSRPELLSNNTLPEGAAAATRVKSYLSTADLLAKDVATAEAQITYLKLIGNDLEPAASYSDADFVQVDLNRVKVDGIYGFYTAQGNHGVIQGIVTGALSGNNSVVELLNHYYNVDYSQLQTYPLRSTESAWRLLQSGEGYIASPGKNDKAVIRNVSLGYFESEDPQPYLQPIYVFSGDDGFLGYVPALDPRVYLSITASPQP